MKNNKILIVILIMFLILSFSINIYAYDFTDINENKQSIQDIPENLLSKNFCLSYYREVYTLWVMTDNTGYFYIDGNYVYSSINPVERYEYNKNINEWKLIGRQYLTSGSSDWILKRDFSYSNTIVYSNKAQEGIFFYQPQTIMGAVAMKTEVTKQLKTTIAGFLKYLIVLVISLIAFYKGWQFLSMQLRKA